MTPLLALHLGSGEGPGEGIGHGDAGVETVIWDGPDGFELNGVLVYPPDYEEGRRYPLVLNIHGGPMWASHEAFDTFNQIMAAPGVAGVRSQLPRQLLTGKGPPERGDQRCGRRSGA